MNTNNEQKHLKDAKTISKCFLKSVSHKKYKKESSEFLKEIIPVEQHESMKNLIDYPDINVFSNGFKFKTGGCIDKEEFDIIIQIAQQYKNYRINKTKNGIEFSFFVRKDLSY